MTLFFRPAVASVLLAMACGPVPRPATGAPASTPTASPVPSPGCALRLLDASGAVLFALDAAGQLRAAGPHWQGSTLSDAGVRDGELRPVLVREGDSLRLVPTETTLALGAGQVRNPAGARVRVEGDGAVRVAEGNRAWLDTGWRVEGAAVGPGEGCNTTALVLVVLGRWAADNP